MPGRADAKRIVKAPGLAHVEAARDAGLTWADIGARRGLAEQGPQPRSRGGARP